MNPSRGAGEGASGPRELSLKHPGPLAAEDNEQEEKSRRRGNICEFPCQRGLKEQSGACLDRKRGANRKA